jgi:hypothetical protein
MLTRLQRLLDKTGLNRYMIDTPQTQRQQTANKSDLGVRPKARRHAHMAASATEMAPRQGSQPSPAAGALASPGASPLSALSPSPARSETALVTMPLDSSAADTAAPHPLIDAMQQGLAALPGLIEHQFGHVGQTLFAKSALRQALQSLAPAMSPVAPVGLPGMPAVLLSQTLALAAGADASRATAALAALRQMDPVADIGVAWQRAAQGERAGPTPPDEADAWRIAMELSATPTGMRLLQTIVARPLMPAQEKDFALLMKTTSALAARNPELEATPAAMLAAQTPPGTLLAEALACASARLAGEVQAAQPHAWALNAVRNDMLEIGPGSDFNAADARLMKLGRWIDVAADDHRFALRNPMTGKSAFRALRYGAQQVDRGPAVAKHRKAFDVALRNAAAQLRDQLVQMAPFTRAGGMARPPQTLLRAAVLDHCIAAPASALLDGKTFDAAALDDIANRLASQLSGGDEGMAMELAPRLRQQPDIEALASQPMSMERLDEWLADAVAEHAALPTASAESGASWAEAIATELQAARREVDGHDTRLPQVSREGVRESLKHIVRNIEGSSRLRLTSGGIVGVGLKQLSAAVTGLVSGFLLRGKVDARKQWGRQAVFEIAMPPYDMEIMVATQRQGATQFGFGAFAGADLGVVKAGGNADFVVHGSESSAVKGVTLRLPRIGRPVSELREEFAKLVDRLLDGTGAQAGSGEPLLKQLLQEFPELTVNRVGRAGDERKRHGVTVEGQASASFMGLRASAAAGVAAEAQRGVIRHYEDEAGSMQVERHIEAGNVRGAVGARLTAGGTADAGPVNLTSGNTDNTVIGVSADIIVAGSSERREVVRQDGRLHPISFKETEYLNFGNFLERMDRDREQWVQARLASPGTTRTHEGELVKLQTFLGEIEEHATPTHTYAVRSTIRPEAAARVDAFTSSAQLAARQITLEAPAAPVVHPSAPQTVSAMLEAAEAEWSKPESLQPYSLRAYERVTTQETNGLNLVAQFATLHAADASHIDHRLDAA